MGEEVVAVKISSKFRKMSEVYSYFARDYVGFLDFTPEMLEELFIYESTGKGDISEKNGFATGKRNVDIAVSSWIEDIEKGNIWIHELYEDENLPAWFLDKVLSQYSHRPKTQSDFDAKIEEYRKSLMPNYTDYYGRIHDRPVTPTDPFPCNNSFAFSGYASVLDISLDKAMIYEAWMRCQTAYGYNRNPDNKTFPASSHDEVVGMFMLEDISGAKDLYKKLERSRFQVCNLQDFKPAPIYKLNPLRVVADFYKLSKEENARKATWKYPYIAPIIFRHAFQHTHFYARCSGNHTSAAHSVYTFLSNLVTVFCGSNSSKVMLGMKLLKLKKLGQTLPEKLITKIFNLRVDFVREVMEYFPTAHPIVVAAVKKGKV